MRLLQAHCAALVATRGEMTSALLATLQSSLGEQQAQGAAASLRAFEARLGALEGQAAVAVQESRAAVAAVGKRVDELREEHEAALGRINAALLAIAKRVGALAPAGH